MLPVSSCPQPCFPPHCGRMAVGQLTAGAAVPTQGYCPVLKLHNKKQEHPSSMDTPVFGSPSWTRTNDQIGQKQRSPQRLGAALILPVSSCPQPCFPPHCGRMAVGQLTAGAAVPTQGYCPVLKLHNKKQEHPSSMDTPVFGSPSWTRTNDPAVNSRMLYQLSY